MFSKLSNAFGGSRAYEEPTKCEKIEAPSADSTEAGGSEVDAQSAQSSISEAPIESDFALDIPANNLPDEAQETFGESVAAAQPAMEAVECADVAADNGGAMDRVHTATAPRRAPPPAHSADRQAARRAMKRYREVGGKWVKGKLENGAWIPEAHAPNFGSLELALQHEQAKTAMRRSTWTNLRSHIASTRSAVMAEAAHMRRHTTEESEFTRIEIANAKEALSQQFREGIEKMTSSHPPTPSSQLDFYCGLSELRAVDLRQLLEAHSLEAVGTKSVMAKLCARQLQEHALDEFLSKRCCKRQRTHLSIEPGQRTLQSLFVDEESEST